jgi:hypothetical protein
MLDAARDLGVHAPIEPEGMDAAESDLLGCLSHLEIQMIKERFAHLAEQFAANPSDPFLISEMRNIDMRRKELLREGRLGS